MVVKDNISTYFLHSVTVNANNVPQNSYSGAFMTEHTIENMSISVMAGNGKTLAAALSELKSAYPDAGIDDNVIVGMTYTWNGRYGYDIDGDSSNLPEHNFGSESISVNSDGRYYVGYINFKLAGIYTPSLTITIGDVTYNSNSEAISVVSTLKQDVTVEWSIKPHAEFTGVSGNNSVCTKYEANLKYTSEEDCGTTTYTTNDLTIILSNAGTFDEATLEFANSGVTNSNVKYIFTPSKLESTTTVGSSSSNKDINDGKATEIVLKYNGVAYTLPLVNELKLTNTKE